MPQYHDPLDKWRNIAWSDTSKPKAVREQLVMLVEKHNLVEYIPYWPSPLQLALRGRQELEGLIGGEPRAGKAQPLDAVVMTPFGPSTMGQMKVGSLVSNPDGTVATVIGVYPQPEQQIYRVTFQDGASTRVTGEHLWLVYQTKRHLKAERKYEDGTPVVGRIRTTNQLREWMAVERVNTQTPCIPLTEPVIFTIGRGAWGAGMDVNPYILGLLLGDGSFRGDTIKYSSDDQYLVNVMQAHFGDDFRYEGRYDYRINNAPLRRQIEALGLLHHLSNDKFVPRQYKLAGTATRREVLQGLMDTDGTVDARGGVSFTSVSKQLADDVRWLAQSLGAKVSVSTKTGAYRLPDGTVRECQLVYTLYIQSKNNAQFFTLPRKVARCGPNSLKPSTYMRHMVSIEPDGFDVAQCIQVDHPNGLYLTDDFIVTHNTAGLLIDNICDTTVDGFTSIFFRRTLPELNRKNGLIDTCRQWFAPYPEWVWNEGLLEWRNKKYNSAFIFAFLGQKGDEDNLLGFEFQRENYEELTRLPFTDDWNPYITLFHRLNRPIGMPVKMAVRATANPGGDNEKRVMDYFLSPFSRRYETGGNGAYLMLQKARPDPDPEKNFGGIFYLHAQIEDNPSIDAHSYRSNLSRMDSVTQDQMARGMWGVARKGGVINTGKIKPVPSMPWNVMMRTRNIDKASSEAPASLERRKRQPPRTACVRMSRLAPGMAAAMWGPQFANIEFVIEHAIAGYWTPGVREDAIDKIAGGGYLPASNGSGDFWWNGDGFRTVINHEQEPGSGGMESAEQTSKRLIRLGYTVNQIKPVSNKEARVAPFAAAVDRGMYGIVESADWDWEEYLAELGAFPKQARKDYPDATGLGHSQLVLLVPDSGALYSVEDAPVDMSGFRPYDGFEGGDLDARVVAAIQGMARLL